MAKVKLDHEFDLKTRNSMTNVDAVVTFSVSGRELPTMAVLGEALEQAIKVLQTAVTESYKVVPPRLPAEPVVAHTMVVPPQPAQPTPVSGLFPKVQV